LQTPTGRPNVTSPPSHRSSQLHTVNEAAQQLAVKPSTIRKWILLERIGVVRLSARCIRIPQTEIDRIIAQGFTPAREVQP
jgi:excisionase family DNA binding protein